MTEKSESEEKQPWQHKIFPIVGIGASAGGLEALREFLNNTPVDTGMVFVVVTHQHPGHESLLAEILSRETAMPVIKITDGMRVEPDHVYILGSGVYVEIEEMILHLKEIKEGTIRMPIDAFFRSLAEDAHEQAIGVVLSGTGSDGSRGIREIKGQGGLALAQETPSALYGGMPDSARNTGLVDFVLKPADMAKQILNFIRMLKEASGEQLEPDGNITTGDINAILRSIRSRLGHDFTSYKQSTVRRRILRRMSVHGISKAIDYLSFLQENQQEAQMLLSEMLIGVTNFFRDPEAFMVLRDKYLPTIIQSWPAGQDFRVWVAGCATGEEAYSIAIILDEVREQCHKSFDIRIFATDLDNEAIEIARKGTYSAGISVDVSSPRISRFFTGTSPGGYTVRKEIRDMVVFAQHNMLSDPPFLKLQLVMCRNVLIYLQGDIQKRLLPLFHHALNPDGLLFLGLSESIGTENKLFEPLDVRLKIFKRADVATGLPGMPIKPAEAQTSMQERTSAVPGRTTTDRLVEKMLLEHFAPVTIVFDLEGTITYIHGRTGAYLEPEQRRPRNNVFEMAREGLKTHLKTAVHQVLQKKGQIIKKGLRVKSDCGYTTIDLTISRIVSPEALRGLMMAVISPSADKSSNREPPRKPEETAHVLSSDLKELQRELDYTREINQSLAEEMQSNKEEMQSSNEELQSTNEELQSSKEEMESLNEELSTVNSELNIKVQELAQARDDIQNLLNSTDVAVIFLDRRLCVKRYTPKARTLVNLRDGDIGRPISDLNLRVLHENLFEDSHHVLNTLERREREVDTVDGRRQLMRILPYRSSEDVIGGVVVTLVDITEIKQAEKALYRSEERFKALVLATSYVIYRISADWKEMRELKGGGFLADTEGPDIGWIDKYILPEDQLQVWSVIQEAIHAKKTFEMEHRIRRIDGSIGWTYSYAVPLFDETGKLYEWFGAAGDITKRKRAEEALRKSESTLNAIIDSLPTGVLIADNNGKITRFSQVAREMLGVPAETESPVLLNDWVGWWPDTGQRIKAEEWAIVRALKENKEIRNELVLTKLFGSDKQRYFFNSAVPLLDADRKISGAVAAIVDVNERILGEKTLQKRNEQLAAINQELESFSFSVSHDLRNPLQNIYNYVNYLLEDYADQLDNDAQDMLHRVMRSASKMKHIIDDLLTLSRIGRHDIKREEIDLCAIVRDHFDELAATDPKRHVEWVVPNSLIVKADKRLLHLAIENLMRNAWKFTSKKTDARIELGNLEKDGETVYYIRDNGVGFDMKFAKNIFEPFKRTHPEKEFSGTGIGLSIVERIIRCHGGKVWAEGEPDKGATFYFTLG